MGKRTARAGRRRGTYNAFIMDMEGLPSHPGGENTSEDIGSAAGDIDAVGEGQIRVTGAAECKLVLIEPPAEGPRSRWMSHPSRRAWRVLLTGRGSSRARYRW